MRCLFRFTCAFALCLTPVLGCSETTGDGGSGGTAGDGGSGGIPECQNPEDCNDREECTTDACVSGVCENTAVDDGTTCAESNECAAGQCASGACQLTPVTDGTTCGDDKGTCQDGTCEVACTEQGIRDAIAAGGGPYTFDCAGPQTVVTEAEIVVDNDVVLDGEGNLTLDGNNDHAILFTGPARLGDPPPTAELRGFRVTGAPAFGIMNAVVAISVGADAALTLTDCAVSDNEGVGIGNQDATLTLRSTTVSNSGFANLANGGALWVKNSTISGGEVGISNTGQMTISSSTVVSGNLAFRTAPPGDVPPPTVTFANTIVAGGCEGDVANGVTSRGYNIESPGDTCGFNQLIDQVNVSADDLMLGPLQVNGGDTMTHALGVDGVAIDRIPALDCGIDEDQRGVMRPQGDACDVGAFELEVGP